MSKVKIMVNNTTPTLVPSKTSDLTNDMDFISVVKVNGVSLTHEVDEEAPYKHSVNVSVPIKTVKRNGAVLSPDNDKAVDIEVPTDTIQLDNSAGFITQGTAQQLIVQAVAAEATTRHTEDNKKVDKVTGKGLSTNDYTTDEKTKLAGIDAGAQVNVIETVKVNGVELAPVDKSVDVIVPVSSVNGLTGAVTLTKNNVGLENVDNTSDLDKPISTSTQTALDEIKGKSSSPVWEQGQARVENNELVEVESTKWCRMESAVRVTYGDVVHFNDNSNFIYQWIYFASGKWYSSGSISTDRTISFDGYIRISAHGKSSGTWPDITPKDCNGIITVEHFAGNSDRWDDGFYKTFSLYDHLYHDGAFWTSGEGRVGPSTAEKVSDFIPVKSGQKIVYDLSTGANYVLVYYDDNKEFVSGIGSGSGTFDVPADGYVRFACKNDYTGRVIFGDYQIPDQVQKEISRIDKTLVNNTTGTDYMQSAISRITGELTAKSDLGNIAVFGFNTDQHIKTENEKNAVRRGMQVLSKLTQKYPYDFICLGGDAPGAYDPSTTLAEILGYCVEIQESLYDTWCPVIPITGNHDAAQNNANMTGKMLFNAHFKRIANSGFLNGWDNSHTNGYWDSPAHKIRFIFFDDTTRSDYTTQQRHDALSEMVSGTPSGYNIIILSHHPISSALTNQYWQNPLGLQDVINTYASRIICCICGHNHIDVSETVEGILYIGTTLAAYAYDQAGNRGTLDTETETAFDTFVIDQAHQHIYSIRYGHGNNRDWTYTL